MHDIKAIRDNPQAFDAALKRRGLAAESPRLLAIDEKRRAAILASEQTQARRNAASKEIGDAKKAKDEARAAKLMAEVAAIKAATNPHETLLVADSLTGQDAVNIAKNFNDRLKLSGIILTRVDGDARGGAALSMRAVTGAPIKFMGAGEKLDALEPSLADTAEMVMTRVRALTRLNRPEEAARALEKLVNREPSNVEAALLLSDTLGAMGRPTASREVLLSGGQVFSGYWNAGEVEPAQRGGWFATGDIGELDEAGYLRITGRKKEIIITAGGKNVAPAPLEDRLRAHPLVGQCVVIGDNRPYVTALITLEPDGIAHWRRVRKKERLSDAEIVEDRDLLAELQRAVDDANTLVSRPESIRRFRVLARDFTEANGHLTPSMKLRRARIAADFAAEIESLYQRR